MGVNPPIYPSSLLLKAHAAALNGELCKKSGNKTEYKRTSGSIRRAGEFVVTHLKQDSPEELKDFAQKVAAAAATRLPKETTSKLRKVIEEISHVAERTLTPRKSASKSSKKRVYEALKNAKVDLPDIEARIFKGDTPAGLTNASEHTWTCENACFYLGSHRIWKGSYTFPEVSMDIDNHLEKAKIVLNDGKEFKGDDGTLKTSDSPRHLHNSVWARWTDEWKEMDFPKTSLEEFVQEKYARLSAEEKDQIGKIENVRYLSRAERNTHITTPHVVTDEGENKGKLQLKDPNGRPLEPGEYIFVLAFPTDDDGNHIPDQPPEFLTGKKAKRIMQHSSLAAGGPVLSAGMMYVGANGIVGNFKPHSGHYKPQITQWMAFQSWIKEQCPNFEMKKVGWGFTIQKHLHRFLLNQTTTGGAIGNWWEGRERKKARENQIFIINETAKQIKLNTGNENKEELYKFLVKTKEKLESAVKTARNKLSSSEPISGKKLKELKKDLKDAQAVLKTFLQDQASDLKDAEKAGNAANNSE